MAAEQGCIRREGALEAAPEAVRKVVKAVGGGYYRTRTACTACLLGLIRFLWCNR